MNARRANAAGLSPAFAVARARVGVFALAGMAWCSTIGRMAGIDAGPGTSL